MCVQQLQSFNQGRNLKDLGSSFVDLGIVTVRTMTSEERRRKIVHPWGPQAYDDYAQNGTCLAVERRNGLGHLIYGCCVWPSAYNASMTYDWPVEVIAGMVVL